MLGKCLRNKTLSYLWHMNNTRPTTNPRPGCLTPGAIQPKQRICGMGWAAIYCDPNLLFRLGNSTNFSIRSIETTRVGADWYDYRRNDNNKISRPPACTFLELTHADGRGWVFSLEMGGDFELYFTLYECRTKRKNARYNAATNQQSVALDKLFEREIKKWETGKNVAA